MLSYIKFPVIIVVWMVALMSGILSIAREAYGIFSGTVPPRTLLWSCLWVAFVMSATVSWGIEHKKCRDERNKSKIAPDIEVQVSTMITRGMLGVGVTDLFIQLVLTLKAPSEVVIDTFSLAAMQETQYVHASAVDDLTFWELIKEKPEGGYLHLPCSPMTNTLRQRGDPVEGWVHCRLTKVTESWLLNSMLWVKLIVLTGLV